MVACQSLHSYLHQAEHLLFPQEPQVCVSLLSAAVAAVRAGLSAAVAAVRVAREVPQLGLFQD